MPHYTNCLYYALDRWAHEGGGLLFVRSTHWCFPHVQHRSNSGAITHFVPPHDLTASWHSLFGFYGTVEDIDELKRAPIKPLCMLAGSAALLLFGGWWAIKRTLANLVRPVP